MLRSLLCGRWCVSNTEDVRKLEFSHSLLQDVPADVFLYERTLEKLCLASNHIVELPRQLFNCDELRTLNLSDNEINFLPPAISSLINLQKLDISKNAITSLPDNIRSCTSLTYLDVSINPLEKFPESLVHLVSLTELYLTDVYLEFLPANFGKLINLRILELRENNLVTLPKTMSRLIHLTRLDIGNNEFSELPDVVNSLHNLTELWIDGNHIRRLSPGIGQLRRMLHFEASNNNIEFLPKDVGYWTRVVEFSISNNDLSHLPSTVGNMKNLIGLKLDDNNLKTLPDSIGKLINLEELMLSHNYLSHLPTSIGLLRKLQVLTVDGNMLIDIPPELGSCTSLSILSLRGNRISDVPAEIGHLSSLRVLNLVENHLSYLPMSLLKLDKLSALWLSTNQSQPLVPLQQEMNSNTYQLVLTCFMLPQLSHKRTEHTVEETCVVPRQIQHKHICFASDTGITVEQPGRLTRAPTPYPKELRALAKHAKNIQRGLTVSQHTNKTEKVMQQRLEGGPIQIKEAKVTVTPHNLSNNDNIHLVNENKNTDIYSGRLSEGNSDIEYVSYHTETSETTQPLLSSSSLSQPVVLAFDSSPVIREAKNIRTDMQSQCYPSNTSASDHKSLELQSLKNDCKITNTPQPPPYHVAAIYSLQAQFFNSYSREAESESATHSTCSQVPSSTVSTLERKRDFSHNLNNNSIGSAIATNSLREHSVQNDETAQTNTSDIAESENKFTDDDLSQSDYKPRMFIQDKPAPGQNIVIPTPKRPNGLEQNSSLLYLPTANLSLQCSDFEQSSNILTPAYIDSNIISLRSYRSDVPVHADSLSQTDGISTATNIINNNVSKNKSAVQGTSQKSHLNCVSDSGSSTGPLTKWMFGQHKNATVLQITVNKNPNLGFTISEKKGKGIYVEKVLSVNASAVNTLKIGDKILEVEGVDFTKLNLEEAQEVLNSITASTVSMMISHMN